MLSKLGNAWHRQAKGENLSFTIHHLILDIMALIQNVTASLVERLEIMAQRTHVTAKGAKISKEVADELKESILEPTDQSSTPW